MNNKSKEKGWSYTFCLRMVVMVLYSVVLGKEVREGGHTSLAELAQKIEGGQRAAAALGERLRMVLGAAKYKGAKAGRTGRALSFLRKKEGQAATDIAFRQQGTAPRKAQPTTIVSRTSKGSATPSTPKGKALRSVPKHSLLPKQLAVPPESPSPPRSPRFFRSGLPLRIRGSLGREDRPPKKTQEAP